MVKKLVSLVCSIALLMAVCVPAFAADPATDPITADNFSGSIQVGDYTYFLSSETKGDIAAYLLDLQSAANTDNDPNNNIALLQLNNSITEVKDEISAAHSANPSFGPDRLWDVVSNEHNFETIKTQLGITGVSFNYPTLTVTDSYGINPTFTLSSSKKSSNDSDNSSGSASPSAPSTPSNSQTTTTTGADGKTTVGVTTAPDSAPTVSGGTSSFGVTVPSTAVSAAAAAATAEKHAAVTISAPSDTLISQLNSSAVQKVSMSLKVPADVAYGTAANVDVSMNLDSSVLQAAKQTSKDITVGVVDQLTGKEAYSWTFKGTDLANASTIGSVNMALNVKTSTLDSEVSGKVPASEKGIVLTFANNGTLPAPAAVKVLVSDQGYQAGQTVHMYYFNSATKQVETLDTSAYTVDADGYVTVVIDHCSKYIISSGVIAAVNPVAIDTGKKLSVKAGKTYQFKITATAKPTFKSGSNSVFSVTANGSNGNNYYFKVTAVGKAGQSAGFYVNGEKTPRTIGTIV